MANLKYDSFPCIRFDVSQWYADPEFQEWFLDQCQHNYLATWHNGSKEFSDCSDAFITYDYGEGSNYDMPEKLWDQLCKTLGSGQYLVWLTNLAN